VPCHQLRLSVFNPGARDPRPRSHPASSRAPAQQPRRLPSHPRLHTFRLLLHSYRSVPYSSASSPPLNPTCAMSSSALPQKYKSPQISSSCVGRLSNWVVRPGLRASPVADLSPQRSRVVPALLARHPSRARRAISRVRTHRPGCRRVSATPAWADVPRVAACTALPSFRAGHGAHWVFAAMCVYVYFFSVFTSVDG
jgi:hypothetical protein